MLAVANFMGRGATLTFGLFQVEQFVPDLLQQLLEEGLVVSHQQKRIMGVQEFLYRGRREREGRGREGEGKEGRERGREGEREGGRE